MLEDKNQYWNIYRKVDGETTFLGTVLMLGDEADVARLASIFWKVPANDIEVVLKSQDEEL